MERKEVDQQRTFTHAHVHLITRYELLIYILIYICIYICMITVSYGSIYMYVSMYVCIGRKRNNKKTTTQTS